MTSRNIDAVNRRHSALVARVRELEDRIALTEQALKQLIIVGGMVPKLK